MKIILIILLFMNSEVTLAISNNNNDLAPSIEFAPSWIYTVEHYQLPNGMKVTLKKTDMANNVAIRIKVNYGQDDEECGMQETPHFLEHLLFTGTTRYTEIELEDLVDSYGASWNAETAADHTTYIMDVYSGYASEGLQILHHILSDSTITQENVDKSRDIIHREDGGAYSEFTQWMYKHGHMKSAFEFFGESLGARCSVMERADDIHRPKIMQAYADWYVPNNMHIYIVGKLPDGIRDEILTLFGEEEFKTLAERRNRLLKPSIQHRFTGSLEPLKGDETQIFAAYYLPAFQVEDEYPLQIMAEYLSTQLYYYLRIEEGLSYSPEADLVWDENGGIFYFYSDFNTPDWPEGEEKLHQFIHSFIEEGMTQEELDHTRKKLLLSEALYSPTNASLVNWYRGNELEFDPAEGRFVNVEAEYRKVTIEQIQAVARKYLGSTQYQLVDEPTMTLNQFWVLLIGSPAVLLALIVWVVWRRKIRKPNNTEVLS
jgi:predicted Zn-dependent peptidase